MCEVTVSTLGTKGRVCCCHTGSVCVLRTPEQSIPKSTERLLRLMAELALSPQAAREFTGLRWLEWVGPSRSRLFLQLWRDKELTGSSSQSPVAWTRS